TGSTRPLITKSMVEEAMAKRDHRPLIIIDLSVPRNVAKDVGQLESVTVFDVDDTEVIIKETYEKRKAEIAKAEDIVNKMADNYMTWLSSLNLSPTIRQIQENFRKINDMEFENYHNFKNGADRKPIREYGSHIVDKFTRLIIENLKDLTDNGRKVEHLNMLNELFELTIANEK
ncbi:MAG: hypothetical protein L3J31_08095, partial [Bacteroidales bacterium]|nr:hypothetical protein [Bacteroidales bacterium]